MVIEAVQVPQNFIFSRNSVPFRSVPSSSAELGMPRNGHFLPRNNGNRSESIPRNFIRNEILFPTLGVGGLRNGGHIRNGSAKNIL